MEIKKNMRHIAAVDLFCGAGGLSHGLQKGGIDVRLGIDNDPACEYAYSKNNNADFLLKSVASLSGDDIRKAYKLSDFTLLAGCAPCQTFSTYNNKATAEDDRWWLLGEFARLIDETTPDFVTMENVPGLLKHDVFNQFLDSLKKHNYYIDYRIINCEEYGIPQTRKRLVLLASKHKHIKIISHKEFGANRKNINDVIANLPTLSAGEQDKVDPLHISSTLSELNIKRILASIPGGTWRDWPYELRAKCHTKKTGKTYPSVYGRMSWDKPSPTITTQFYGFGNGRFGHPTQNRAISLREGALLQTFPPNYKFVENKSELSIKQLGKIIGNAVPVDIGKLIAKSIINHINRNNL